MKSYTPELLKELSTLARNYKAASEIKETVLQQIRELRDTERDHSNEMYRCRSGILEILEGEPVVVDNLLIISRPFKIESIETLRSK